MSHFSVLVVTEGGTDEEVVDALRPFHEYECTGRRDEFVVEVDITFKAQRNYEKAPSYMVESPEGEVVSKYDDRFYRIPTAEESAKIGPVAGTGGGYGMSWRSQDWKDGRGYSTRVYDLPSHWVEKHDLRRKYMSFEEWVLAEYSPTGDNYRVTYKEDGTVDKVFQITNPHAKWDYYSIGGRWGNRLLGKNTRPISELLDIDFVTFAVLLPGGIWTARGDMGWWGCVSDELAHWDDSYKKLLGSLRPDFYGTVVDCHI